MKIAGKQIPKWAVYGSVGAAAVGGFLWYRNRSSSSSPAATGAADPNLVDPATGVPYADETAGNYAGYTQGTSGLGYGLPTSDITGSQLSNGTSFTSNAQWAQAVEAGLTGLGYDAQAVGSAVGKYLLDLPLTSDQVTIVQTAVAEYGPPPVGTHNIIAGGTAPPPPLVPPPAGTPPPPAAGGPPPPHPAHGPFPAPGHFRVAARNAHGFTLAWDKVPGASAYHVKVVQLNGKVVGDFQEGATSASLPGSPGWSYHCSVQALPGGHGTNLTVTLPHH